MKQIAFDQKIVFTPDNSKPGAGTISQVNRLLESLYKVTLPDGFFESGSKASPTKQISKWLHDDHQIKMDVYLQSQIGNLIEYSCPSGTYIFDFTHDLGWKSGEFGDRGSCFMTEKRHMLLMIQDAGGFAVRFYHDDGGGKARAWLLPIEGDSERYGIFNAHGHATSIIGSILSAYLETEGNWHYDYEFHNPETKHNNGLFYVSGAPYVLGEALKGGDKARINIPRVDRFKTCKCGRVMHISDETCAYCKEGQNATGT